MRFSCIVLRESVNLDQDGMDEMTETNEQENFQTLTQIMSAMQPLDQEARKRILQTVATFFGIEFDKFAGSNARAELSIAPGQRSGSRVEYSEDLAVGPKEFLLEKHPQTDVERVACLAYYLTHYRDMPQFKTLDISKLNLEAAQPKFSNAAYATGNAVKLRYLVSATRDKKQLSAAGEQFVLALPVREEARAAMAAARPKRRTKKKRKKGSKEG